MRFTFSKDFLISLMGFRRALCQISIARPHKAVVDLKKVLTLDPNNKLARTQLDATQKLIRKADFERVSGALFLFLFSSLDVLALDRPSKWTRNKMPQSGVLT